MAVSPSDFALYSRVTGRAIPSDRGARMKMAPEVNRFIRNREYERPQKTTLQKGADLLGKAAMIGGTLAAAHAIGGGFRGKTAENVGKVADVVQNLAKTGDVGAEGGKVVQNVAKATAGMAPLSNEVYGALQQEEMLNNLAQPAVDVQTSVADRGTALADRILNRPGGDLDRLDKFRGEIPPNTGGGDTILSESYFQHAEHYARILIENGKFEINSSSNSKNDEANKDGQDQKADNRNNNDKNVSNENGLDSDVSEKISQSEDLESTAEEISQN